MLLAECCPAREQGLLTSGEQKEEASLVPGLKNSDSSSIPSGVSQLLSGAGCRSLGLLRKIILVTFLKAGKSLDPKTEKRWLGQPFRMWPLDGARGLGGGSHSWFNCGRGMEENRILKVTRRQRGDA